MRQRIVIALVPLFTAFICLTGRQGLFAQQHTKQTETHSAVKPESQPIGKTGVQVEHVVKDKDVREIKWQGIKKFKVNDEYTEEYLTFEGASIKHQLPYYYEKIKVAGNYSYSAIITNPQYKECSSEETIFLKSKKLSNEISVQSTSAAEKRVPYLCVSFVPLRINKITGRVEKLVSFKIELVKEVKKPSIVKKRTYAAHSVLDSGTWYKIAVTDNGIYKLTYNDLKNLGINVSSLNPKNIRIYGNGGGMLPEANSGFRYDDLVENAIYVNTDSNTFSSADYILFYGQSPTTWNYSSSDNKFHHQTNYYSRTTNYFINTDIGPGKRIAQQASVASPANKVITKFNDYLLHEKDSINLMLSGKEWYGEFFDIQTSYSFNFQFPNVDPASNIYIQTDIAGKYTSNNYYTVNANGNTYTTAIPYVAASSYYVAANSVPGSMSFPASSNVNVTITKTTANAVGWLNYVELNATRLLTFLPGAQLLFRNISSVGTGNISKFAITTNTFSNLMIWDVTNPVNVKDQQFSTNGDSAIFKLPTDSLRQFVAFDGSTYSSPMLLGKIANQDLHGLPSANLIIVTYPDYISEAQAIGNIHFTNDNLSYVIVTPEQIYNEFSSGNQDVSAIRDFVKMFYDKYTTASEAPKYLLLFGDASYDYKNRLTDNTNFVPTFESSDGFSLDEESSYCTDDFFGFLDSTEGPYGLLDVGIGRFPVNTVTDANTMVNKVNQYLQLHNPANNSNSCTSFSSIATGDWRNVICLVTGADDESFFASAEGYANMIDSTYLNYNVDKIYSNAYEVETGAGGQRFPQVEDAINRRIAKGALIMNYIGHGGQLGWALERILQIPDIQSWTNINNMPFFLTATCQFSVYDNPAQIAAGEMVLLSANGGGIALLTSSRVTEEGSNNLLCGNFYHYALKKINGSYPTFGEINMLAKNAGSTSEPYYNYVLLGDPALRLSYPVNNVITTSINGHPANTTYDTLKAFEKVTISGIIQDPNGIPLNSFNGIIYPTVYDKPTLSTTLANDPGGYVENFYIQNSILYKGKASVTNGNFSFTFVVPKDIAYNYGLGKISYYAENASTNASGYYENKYFIIGGSKTNVANDKIGPSVKLYLNDSTFAYGGMTNQNPILIATIFDSIGVNTVGNGVGHNLEAILDNNTQNPIVLNDYYEANLNSYQKGKIMYPFSNLTNGTHTLQLKVWDSYDNLTEVSTEFVVAQSGQLALNHVL
ncbi:MAG: type IX secretion system sortase PorU, partial [Bacteroidales bacterium]